MVVSTDLPLPWEGGSGILLWAEAWGVPPALLWLSGEALLCIRTSLKPLPAAADP